jgi:hypothetical protein
VQLLTTQHKIECLQKFDGMALLQLELTEVGVLISCCVGCHVFLPLVSQLDQGIQEIVADHAMFFSEGKGKFHIIIFSLLTSWSKW